MKNNTSGEIFFSPQGSILKLNLGCGNKHKPGYLNIDIQEPCDLKHDLRTPLPFADGSVDEIFSESNTICLFSRKEWQRLKKEITRVLKDGGKLEVLFLDLEYILKAFLENKEGQRWGWWWQTIFSAQENEYDFSKNGFTYNKMVSDLSEEGMINFKKSVDPKHPEYIHLTCYKLKPDKMGKMKILIGTPIHEIKDYCMERWITNVAELQKASPADLLLVDNSPGFDYVEKVKGYCKKHGFSNYQIMHFEIQQGEPKGEKVGRAREIIRQYVLSRGYDAWFSWESDQIIPTSTLSILSHVMEAGNYAMVHPGTWSKEVQLQPEVNFGVCLIQKQPLEKHGFLIEYPNMSGSWLENEIMFKKHILKEGGSYIEVYGLIKPIYHLDK